MPKQPKVFLRGVTDLWTTNPQLSAQLVDPEVGYTVSAQSGKKTSWVCDKGHIWDATIANRSNGRNCPYCSNRRILVGYNDLASTHPSVAAELLNKDIAKTLVAGSNKKVDWICSLGHKYSAAVISKVQSKNGCPYCAGKKVEVGYNDVATTDPEILQYWGEANNITPYEVTRNSNKKIVFVCKSGHEWVRSVQACVVRSYSCAMCSGQRPIVGVSDLATTDPILAAQLNDPNETPETLMRHTNRKVWWECRSGHKWHTSVSNRCDTSEEGVYTSCPICLGRKLVIGVSDLSTTHPALVAELVDTTLGFTMTTSSHEKVQWYCPKGHTYWKTVKTRADGSGCSVCTNRQVLVGVNDMATTNPNLALELDDPTYSAQDITEASGRSLWWKCEKGHRWKTRAITRARSGCPNCYTPQSSKVERRLVEMLGSLLEDWIVGEPGERIQINFMGRKSMSVDCIMMKGKTSVAVEYDGSYWHSETEARDSNKTLLLLDNGYLVVRLREYTKQNVLPLLDINHTNLLQIPLPYITGDDNLIEAVNQIREWLESKHV